MENPRFEKKHTGYETAGTENPNSLSIEDAAKLETELHEKVEKLYERMLEHPAVKEAITILEGLPIGLSYHNIDHTVEDVIRETILFALASGETDEDVILINVVAAAWHDIGYVFTKNDTEAKAIEMFSKSKASKLIPNPDKVKNIIASTEIIKEGKPSFLEEKQAKWYMLDADLSNFGRKDFFKKSDLYAQELNIDLTDRQKRTNYFTFVSLLLSDHIEHDWHTEGARKLRKAQELQNQKELNELVKVLDDDEAFFKKFESLMSLT